MRSRFGRESGIRQLPVAAEEPRQERVYFGDGVQGTDGMEHLEGVLRSVELDLDRRRLAHLA